MARPPLFSTVLVVTIYSLIFLSVLITDELSPVPLPEEQIRRGLNLTQAWEDLHVIAARPHPYNSKANGVVRDWLLSRVRDVEGRYGGFEGAYVHVEEDKASKVSWDQIYFEGENILVKVDGLGGENVDEEEGAVLFSAHYDSVSTSYGAVDDGIGIVAMLQLLEKVARERTRRTVVFNFNNGEEDGLNGAAAFLKHPWSNLTKVFLNLEGAASGGRPILFRGTSATSLNAFRHNHVSHPHGTILAADAFEKRVLRSRTDFSVYVEQGGMDGLDLAFYKGRSHYHTRFDAIPFIVGGSRTVWSMLDALDGAGLALLNGEGKEEGMGEEVVYFDLWGKFMIIVPASFMKSFNWTFISGAPFIVLFFAMQSKSHMQKGDAAWAKFWFGLLATVAGQAWLVYAYQVINRYIVYSAPYKVLCSHLALAFVTFFITIARQPKSGPPIDPPPLQQTYLLQLTVLSYIFLAIFHFKIPIGGAYPFSLLAGGSFTGWLLGFVKGEVVKTDLGEKKENKGLWAIQLLIVVLPPVLLLWHITVLLIGAMPQGMVDGTPAWLVYAAFGLLSVLMVAPLAPFMPALTAHIAYRRKPPAIFVVTAFLFVLSTAFTSGLLGRIITFNLPTDTRLGFPFTRAIPMKVFFQQRIELATIWNSGSKDANPTLNVRPVTYLTGVPHYLDKFIIPSLPSARASKVQCAMDKDRSKLYRCGWPTSFDMISAPGKGRLNAPQLAKKQSNTITLPENDWLASSVTKISATKLRVSLTGRNTRGCRIYFDNVKVKRAFVDGGDKFPRSTNLTELRLWSRTWDRTFVVDIELDEPVLEKVRGSVACEWSEYESGMTGMPSVGESKIPAFEEVLSFFPQWATLTKLTDGLVEVWSAFEI